MSWFGRSPVALQGLALKSGGTVVSGDERRFHTLLSLVSPDLAGFQGIRFERGILWPSQGAVEQAGVAEFQFKPLNGPPMRRAIGLATLPPALPTGGLLLLGPERWDAAHEARLTSKFTARIPSGVLDLPSAVTALGHDLSYAVPFAASLPPLMRSLFLNLRLNLLEWTPNGLWYLAPEHCDIALWQQRAHFLRELATWSATQSRVPDLVSSTTAARVMRL
ncbi:MAG: hypothetical protein ABI743_14995 [bacterium]